MVLKLNGNVFGRGPGKSLLPPCVYQSSTPLTGPFELEIGGKTRRNYGAANLGVLNPKKTRMIPEQKGVKIHISTWKFLLISISSSVYCKKWDCSFFSHPSHVIFMDISVWPNQIISSKAHWSAPIIDGDGMVIVGRSDGNMYKAKAFWWLFRCCHVAGPGVDWWCMISVSLSSYHYKWYAKKKMQDLILAIEVWPFMGEFLFPKPLGLALLGWFVVEVYGPAASFKGNLKVWPTGDCQKRRIWRVQWCM